MIHIETGFPGLFLLDPRVLEDSRGFFMESWNQQIFNQAIGKSVHFVQDNHSRSTRGVLRGLHYQVEKPQAKLVRVVSGAVQDVVVDLRCSSPTFGKHFSIELSEHNRRMLWIPDGFAHGFLALSESADFLYKTTDYYNPLDERCLAWNDKALAIDWVVLPSHDYIVSEKDQAGSSFNQNGEYFS
jgi:dTDP-4-dehydrorhamnose 3,5-epimerase